ncbi:MAG: LysM peptidoglycan-binding domain-containing protein [Candidatus Aminicenantales bacterium]
MGLFGKSYGEKVQDAVAAVNGLNLGVKNLHAVLDGKVVTLEGDAPSLDVKGRAAQEFNARIDTENTINRIQVAAVAAPPSAASVVEAEQIHVVVAGDTLSALAKKYYGKASLYMKIFEANRDILNNPDLIRIGQKLRIPK